MILFGFTFKNGYLLATRGKEYDIHNDYEWVECSFDSEEACVQVFLRRCGGEWASKSQPASFELLFRGVTRFISKESDPQLIAGSHTVAFVGFLSPEDVDCMNGYLDEQTETNQDFRKL